MRPDSNESCGIEYSGFIIYNSVLCLRINMLSVWLHDHTYSKGYTEFPNSGSGDDYNAEDHYSESDSESSQISEQDCDAVPQESFSAVVEPVRQVIVLEKTDDLHKCELCKKTFKFATNLRAHMVMHSGERPYICEICNKSFPRIATLNRHMQVHTEYKPFKCAYCDKRFRQDVTLKNHIRTHTGERFNCNWCEKSFSRPTTLKQHLRIHMDVMQNAPTSLYSCALCNKTFELLFNLKQHMLIHTS